MVFRKAVLRFDKVAVMMIGNPLYIVEMRAEE